MYRHAACLLLAAAFSQAGTPPGNSDDVQFQVDAASPKLVGPKDATAPYMIELKVTNVPKGSAILWDLYYKDPANGMYYAGGGAQTRIVKTEQAFIFAGPAGGYKVKCRLVKGEDTTELEWEGSIGKGPQPTPPTPPTPTPQPDGAFGLIKVSRDGLAAVQDPNKANTAKKIAASTRSLASTVAAGGFADPSISDNNAKVMLDEWSKLVNAAIAEGKSNPSDWTKWADPIGKAFYGTYTGGKLKTKADWVAALNEIADGLAP